MSEVFELECAANVARSILENAAPCSLDCWEDVVRGWRASKSHLIAALDPKTARRIVPVVHEPTPIERGRAWRAALTGEALSMARGKAADVAISFARLSSDHPNYASAQASVDRWDKNVVLLETCAETLAHLGYSAGCAELGTGIAGEVLSALPGITSGQKLTRAVAAHLRTKDIAPDAAATVAGWVAECAQATPRTGYCVLSANILDILLCSENCAYSTCHNLAGCYCAGPQEYVADRHTLVAYYYETKQRYSGQNLPYKLFRQMAFVDAEGGRAALQKHYGSQQAPVVYTTIRGMVGRLLARLKGIDDTNPRWFRGTEERTADIAQPDLAYADPTDCYLSLARKARPIVSFGAPPCPACGAELDDHEKLVCDDCSKERVQCAGCGCRLDEDECCSDDNGNSYCSDCYGERFTDCSRCGSMVDNEDAISACDNSYCQNCIDRYFTQCCDCEEYRRNDDTTTITRADGETETYCDDNCLAEHTSDCSICEDTFHNDDIDCGQCAECYGIVNLARRLLASPAWERDPGNLRLYYAFQERILALLFANRYAHHYCAEYFQNLFTAATESEASCV